jgi:hypothetical protein
LADQRFWRVHNCQIPDALASLFAGDADANRTMPAFVLPEPVEA